MIKGNGEMVENSIPQLFTLTLRDYGQFWVFTQQAKANRGNVILLHGLGENRCGLNYLLREIAQSCFEAGWNTYRFDLAGCGENTMPLDLDLWAAQLTALTEYLPVNTSVGLICRGASSCIVPADWKRGPVIAIAPLDLEIHRQGLEELPVTQWLEPTSENLIGGPQFWTNLGVEANCIGGLRVPRQFLEQLGRQASTQPGGHWHELQPLSHTEWSSDPLFASAVARQYLSNQTVKLLEQVQCTVY